MSNPTAYRQAFEAAPFDYRRARRLSEELGLAEPVAITLARRGFDEPEAARRFLEAEERHAPSAMRGMEQVAGLVGDAIDAGRRIVVHGDYDADGVCGTAILVGSLRDNGADVAWVIPERSGEGYGLGAASLERARTLGAELLITVDCGIACAEQVASAVSSGMEVIVTDHHEPGAELPECPTLHPRLGGYPCPDLCGAAVAHKLACVLTGEETGLGFAALATVADMVPLVGENRRIVREGLLELRRADHAGVRALAAVSGVDLGRLDEGDVAFRLAPRINAVGRLYRADAGVELLLCADDEERAERLAGELAAANGDRRATEEAVRRGAEQALRELPGELREARGIVLAGEGWHPGVAGIAASRLVSDLGRPVVLLAIRPDGTAKGSGRSIPGFDLLAALEVCSRHLTRFGGHRAAAGLELDAASVPAFREAFAAHANEVLSEDDLVRVERVDAVVGGESLGHEVAEQIERLGPFGQGNPEVNFLVPAARIDQVAAMGEEGRHARFELRTGSGSARGVAFGVNGTLAAKAGEPQDVTLRLELNRWNGTVEPRAVLGERRDPPEAPASGCAECPRRERGSGLWRRVERELEAGLDQLASAPQLGSDRRRTTVDARGRSAVARIAELSASGAAVLVVVADTSRRRRLAETVANPARLGGPAARLACGRCAEPDLWCSPGGMTMVDWVVLARAPDLTDFEHVVVVDPPPLAPERAVIEQGDGFLHQVWGRQELELSERVHRGEWELRPALESVYRGLGGGEARGEVLAAVLLGSGPHPRTPALAARCVRVLCELGLARWSADGGDACLGSVSSGQARLEDSAAFRSYSELCQEGVRFLTNAAAP